MAGADEVASDGWFSDGWLDHGRWTTAFRHKKLTDKTGDEVWLNRWSGEKNRFTDPSRLPVPVNLDGTTKHPIVSPDGLTLLSHLDATDREQIRRHLDVHTDGGRSAVLERRAAGRASEHA